MLASAAHVPRLEQRRGQLGPVRGVRARGRFAQRSSLLGALTPCDGKEGVHSTMYGTR